MGNKMLKRQLRPVLTVFLLLTMVTGITYPLLVTGIAQVFFPHQANGSLMRSGSGYAGSELIGQPFAEDKYFWGRLSATPDFPYNSSSSSGSNLGPLNAALIARAQARLEALRKADPRNTSLVPIDLLTSSGSGLDPHISPAAALYQVSRVARLRQLPEARVLRLMEEYTEGRQLGFLGEPRVNVLKLNLALDRLQKEG